MKRTDTRKASNHVYTVAYRMWAHEIERHIDVLAPNKHEAWEKAFYEAIPEKEGETPYSAWVDSVTYDNGNCRYFNTCEGLAY